MDAQSMAAGGMMGLVGVAIGLVIGVVIGALLIMLGTKLVMGQGAKFGSACLAALASGIAGVIIGIALGFVVGAVAPQNAYLAQIASLVAGFLVTPLIYSALVKTGDGRAPNYVQGLLIYLVQTLVVLALAAAVYFLFKDSLPPGTFPV